MSKHAQCGALSLALLLAAPLGAQKKATSRPVKISDKEAIRETTGLALSTFAAGLRRRLRGDKERAGLLVGKVDPDTPGARAGLLKGDVLLQFDGKPVTSVAALAAAIRGAETDEKLVIEYRRRTKSKVLGKVKWKNRKTKIELGQPGIRQAFGITFAVFESLVRRNIVSTDTPYGLKVKRVDPGSVAAAAGLRKGDLVMKWGGKALYGVGQIRKWLASAEPEAKVVVSYARRKKGAKLLDRAPWKDGQLTLQLRPAKKPGR